jgi:hypothetical protein
MFRLGFAVHTPTYYQMDDIYTSSITANFSNYTNTYKSPDGNFTYSLTTPFKAIGSFAVIFQGQGLVSFDYEFTDYSSAHFSANDFSYSDVNRIISNVYKPSSNFHIGTEWKYKIFSFRAGSAIHSSPFDGKYNFTNGSQAAISYTGGIGFRDNNFFLDLGYSLTQSSMLYSPYSLADVAPSAAIKTNNHRMMMTIGFKF